MFVGGASFVFFGLVKKTKLSFNINKIKMKSIAEFSSNGSATYENILF